MDMMTKKMKKMNGSMVSGYGKKPFNVKEAVLSNVTILNTFRFQKERRNLLG